MVSGSTSSAMARTVKSGAKTTGLTIQSVSAGRAGAWPVNAIAPAPAIKAPRTGGIRG